MSTESRHLATSLFKALDLLTALSSEVNGMTIYQIIEAMGLPRTSLIRILDSLIHYGFVERDEGRRYSVSSKFREWRADDANDKLRKCYQPLLKRISVELGEMAVLGRLEGRRIRHIHFEEPECRVRVIPPIGRKFELHTMAMGKLALSQRPDLIPDDCSPRLRKEIDDAAMTDWAWNRGESEPGIIACGSWLGEASPLTPMLAVTWPEFRYTETALAKLKRILREEPLS